MNFKRLRFTLWTIVLILPLFVLAKIGFTEVQAIWAPTLGSWAHRQQLNIVNSSSATLHANTTIAVTVDTKSLIGQGRLKSDCSDIRIVYQPNDTTNTVLDRHLVYPGGGNCSTSTATRIYFALQSSIASAASDVGYYLYFGNPQASAPTGTDSAFDIGAKDALLVCPFEGSTTCAAGETPSPAESGAIRYGGSKSALSFDGINDSVNAGSQSSIDDLESSGDVTYETWLNFSKDNPSDYPGVFSKGGAKGYLYWTGSVYKMWFFVPHSTTSLDYRGNVTISANSWHHVAYVYVNATKTAKLFFDGSELTYTTSTAGIGTPTSYAADDFKVGVTGSANTNFPGSFDEFRISNFSRYTSNFTPTTTPFVRDEYTKLLLHMDENGDDPRQTTKALDDSGNGNNGTITGAKYVAGLVGSDSSATNTGYEQSGSYAGHEGIFIEEGTTNKITNPSFENSTAYNTNWTGENTDTTFNLDTSLASFTPKMAKRNSAGPFAAGVLVQGANTGAENVSDTMYTSRGTQVSGNFYANQDSSQGSIVLWVTPEQNWNDGGTHLLYGRAVGGVTLYKMYTNTLALVLGGTTLTEVSTASWTAGTTYNVVARWDTKNSLDGTNYASISINDSHTFGRNSAPSASAPESDLYIGANNINRFPANALIEGLTIYRHPLWDGAYGIDVGNGDEINQIWGGAIASSKDPTLITGSWDVVFALPTNASTGELATGTGNAWGHPHSSNLVGNIGTPYPAYGFMMNGTYGNDGFALEANGGTDPTVAALATAEKIYAGGYKTTSDGVTVNQGISNQFTATNGGDYVVRALGHADANCQPQVLITRADGSTEVTHLNGTSNTTRTTPSTYIFTFESPAAENLKVKLINLNTTGTCYWHQVEVLANLVDNPSLETGAVADPWIPTGWTNSGMDAGDTEQESSNAHSGSKSIQFNSGADWTEGIFSTSTMSSLKYFCLGGSSYGDGVTGAYLRQLSGDSRAVLQYSGVTGNVDGNTATSWKHISSVWRATSNNPRMAMAASGANPSFMDDVYIVQLSDVSLTVTPATLENSTETSGIRVDGLDTFTQTLANITTTAGTIKFKFTPRHSYSTAGSFGGTYPAIFDSYYDGNNYLRLYYVNDTSLRLRGVFNGTIINSSYSTPTLDAGSTYDIEISYSAGGSLILKINGATKATNTGVVAFANLPTTAYFGTYYNGTEPYDATYGSAGSITLTDNTTAPYVKFGSHSAKLVNAGTGAGWYSTSINAGNVNTHTLSAYVYDGTTGNVGGTVSSSIAKLVFNGSSVTPSAYTDMGGGWWRLSYSAATSNVAANFGVEVLAGKTIYLDGVQLEEKAYATTYCDGTLGTGYAWTGTANDSTSTRTAETVNFATSGNISGSVGSVSFWFKPQYTTATAQTFLSTNYNDGTNTIILYLSQGASLVFTTGGGSQLIISQTFSRDKWYFVTAAWDSGNKYLSVNGSAFSSNARSAATLPATMGIGNYQNWSANYADSLIADLRIFGSALSEAEVADLYYAGLTSRQDTYATVTVDKFEENTTGTGKGQGPTSVWHMDDPSTGSGQEVHDSSPNLNHLTLSGATWTPTFSSSTNPQGNALSFDGTDDKLSRTYDSDFNFGTGAFTIAGLFRHPSTVAGTDTILARQSGSTGYKVYMNSSGYLCFSVNSDSACTTISYADSKWHHVEAVRGSTTLTMYIDGVQGATTAQASPATVNGTNTLYIGTDSDGASNYWAGFLDEFMVYPYARSATQVKTDVEGGQIAVRLASSSSDTLTDGLVGWWKMDEIATPSLDSSSNGHDMLWNGNATNASGKFANGISLDGTGDYLCTSSEGVCADDAHFDSLGYITVSAWIKPSSVSGTQNIISKTDADDPSHKIALSGNKVTWTTKVYGSSTITSITSLTAGNWYHVVGIREKQGGATGSTNPGGRMQLFINGALEVTGTGQDGNLLNGSGSEKIGCDKNNANCFNGQIDDVRVYNRALTPAEATQLYEWAPAPVAHWKMDEGTGISAQDSSGNGNTGTISGADWTSGKYGKALDFDGTSDNISLGTSLSTNIVNAFTIEAWVKREADSRGNIFNNGYVSKGVQFGISASGTPEAYYPGVYTARTSGTVALNTWTHLVYVRTGSGSGNNLLYINGVKQTLITDVSTDYDNPVSAKYIGSSTTYFNGLLDDVRIYNYARTQKQIVEDMNAGHPAVGSPVGSPIAYYKFDEGADNTCSGGINDVCNSGSSGTTLDAPVTGATRTNSGKYGKTLSFDGSGDYVNLGASTIDFSKLSGFSITGWTNSTSGSIISKYYSMDTGYANTVFKLSQSNSTTLVYCLSTTSGPSTCYPTPLTGTITASVWNHFVASWDGAKMYLYINGRLITSQAATGTLGATASTNMYIGGYRGASGAAGDLNGKIDELKIYNYALSPEEVKVDYNRGAALKLGSTGTDSSNNPSDASINEYCPPGQGTACVAPVAEWKLDEGTGIYAYDTTGNANTGTLGGDGAGTDLPAWAQGKYGKGLSFDGSNDYVDAGSASSLDNLHSGIFTTSAWVKSAGTTSGRIIGKSLYSTDSGWRLYWNTGSTLWAYIKTDGTSATSTSSTTLDTNWHFVTMTYNNSGDRKIYLYIDGKQVSYVGQVAATGTIVTDASNNMKIGGGNNFFTGTIDQVSIFNYARTPAQIAWDYNRGKPVGWWSFDECSGSVANDRSGSSMTGTVSGGVTLLGDPPNSAGGGNYSYTFNGSTGFVDVGAGPTVVNSVSFWIKPTTTTEYPLDLNDTAYVWVNGGTVTAQGFTDATIYVNGNASTSLSSGTWQHVTITTATSLNATDLDIGRIEGVGYMEGSLDDVRVYNYPLTAVQVKELYTGGAVRFGN